LQQVTELAVAGSNGLALLLNGVSGPSVDMLLEKGRKFLERVLLDIQLVRKGLETSSGMRLRYDPQAVLEAYQSAARHIPATTLGSGQGGLDTIHGSVDELFKQLDNPARLKDLQPQQLAAVSEQYRLVASPYLMLVSQATEEFKRGGFSRIGKSSPK